jgi:hypothetical protein
VSNKMIGQCENCADEYCQECTTDGCDGQRFCSRRCEREYTADQIRSPVKQKSQSDEKTSQS